MRVLLMAMVLMVGCGGEEVDDECWVRVPKTESGPDICVPCQGDVTEEIDPHGTPIVECTDPATMCLPNDDLNHHCDEFVD